VSAPAATTGRALFLDRDGTLIVDKVYLADPAGVDLIPGTAEALRRARELGYRLFLFTNQSGIGRGYHTIEDTHRVNARVEELLALPPPAFDGICIAPEAPGQPSPYRKPSPRFILEMIARHGLNPALCYMVATTSPTTRPPSMPESTRFSYGPARSIPGRSRESLNMGFLCSTTSRHSSRR